MEFTSALTSVDDLDVIDAKSEEAEGILIYKHSTRCFISSMAMRQLDGWDMQRIPMYYLDLIRHRDVSNAIADRYQVQHQSPQLLWVVGGKCVANASHSDVSTDQINEWLRNA